MKRIIRLTEADLSRLIRRIIKEGVDGNVLNCLMTATGIGVEDLIKLAPCLELQKDPMNQTNIQACVQAVIPVATTKISGLINFSDPFGSVTKIADMTKKCMACAKVSPVMNESRRRR